MEEQQAPRTDRGKLAFLTIVAALAGGLVLLLAKMPEHLRTGAILWMLIGWPMTFAVLRLWRGYVTMHLADLERRPPPVITSTVPGAKQQGRAELRVVQVSDGEHERHLL